MCILVHVICRYQFIFVLMYILRKVGYICIHSTILPCCASLSIHRNQLLYLFLYSIQVGLFVVNIQFSNARKSYVVHIPMMIDQRLTTRSEAYNDISSIHLGSMFDWKTKKMDRISQIYLRNVFKCHFSSLPQLIFDSFGFQPDTT